MDSAAQRRANVEGGVAGTILAIVALTAYGLLSEPVIHLDKDGLEALNRPHPEQTLVPFAIFLLALFLGSFGWVKLVRHQRLGPVFRIARNRRELNWEHIPASASWWLVGRSIVDGWPKANGLHWIGAAPFGSVLDVSAAADTVRPFVFGLALYAFVWFTGHAVRDLLLDPQPEERDLVPSPETTTA